MRQLIMLFAIGLSIGVTSCSSTRKTERADPQANVNEPTYQKSKDNVQPTSEGHQNREIRKNTR